MNNLMNHYKMKTPLETISNIKTFFEQAGFSIQEKINKQTESNTYYCRIQLYKNNHYVLGTNGKGMTKEFSLASGYGELYERFCNKISFLLSDISYYKLQELNLLNNKDNRSFSEICEKYPLILDWGKIYFQNNIELFEKYYLTLTKNNPQADIFINFENQDNDPIIIDSKFMLRMTGSKGMVAGNSIEEALNQGISELYETWAHENLYLNPPNTYYALSDTILQKLPIWDNICQIRKLGYKLYVLDLGYNYNCPVIATYLLNPNSFSIFLNIGCFPVLDIAVERTITELYQGINSFQEEFFNWEEIPYRTTTPEIILANNGNSLEFLSYDEKIFNNIKFVDIPSDVFLFSQERANFSNQEINEYFKKLNKQNNFNFYYKNNSLSSDITALYIICLDMQPWRQLNNQFNNINNIFKKRHLNEAFLHFDINKLIIENSPLEDIEPLLLELQKSINQNTNRCGGYIGNLIGGDCLSFYSSWGGSIIFSMVDLLCQENGIFNISILFDEDMIFSRQIKKYIFLLNYKMAGYTDEEIKQFYSIFNSSLSLTSEDLNNIYNPHYLLQKIFIEPFRKYYNSKDYEDVLKVAFGNLTNN